MRYVFLGLALGLLAAAALSLASIYAMSLTSDNAVLSACFYGAVLGVLGIAIGYDVGAHRG